MEYSIFKVNGVWFLGFQMLPSRVSVAGLRLLPIEGSAGCISLGGFQERLSPSRAELMKAAHCV